MLYIWLSRIWYVATAPFRCQWPRGYKITLSDICVSTFHHFTACFGRKGHKAKYLFKYFIHFVIFKFWTMRTFKFGAKLRYHVCVIVGRSLPTYYTYSHIISRIFISNFISIIKPIIRICTLLRIFIHFMILGTWVLCNTPESKVLGANIGPNWVPSAPDGPHVGLMNLAIRDVIFSFESRHGR